MLTGEELARKVKALRAGADLSLQAVADRAGCTKSHVWKIESGQSVNPTLNMIDGLCKAFGVSLADFVTESEPKSQEVAVTFGTDAFRICIGLAPATHSVADVMRWMKAVTGQEIADES